jgi:hypothetical protein
MLAIEALLPQVLIPFLLRVLEPLTGIAMLTPRAPVTIATLPEA